MRYWLMLFVVAVSFAVPINILEQKETGAVGTEHFNVSLRYDCNKTISVLLNSGSQPVGGASVRLFYEERYSSLLGTGSTDAQGYYNYTLMGNPKNMKNLFIVTVEKSNFRTTETHFVLPYPCFEPQEPVVPQQNQTQNNSMQQNNTQNNTPPASQQNQTPSQQNYTQNYSNNTYIPPENPPAAKTCLGILFPLAVAFLLRKN
ncbi:MAG: hypothetical protein V1492_00995 [Candidatus Micrarchaeota archaeon]